MSTWKKKTKINYRKLDGWEGMFVEGKFPHFTDDQENSPYVETHVWSKASAQTVKVEDLEEDK